MTPAEPSLVLFTDLYEMTTGQAYHSPAPFLRSGSATGWVADAGR